MRELAMRAARRAKKFVRNRDPRSRPGGGDSALGAAALRAGWNYDAADRALLEALEHECHARERVTLGVLVGKRDHGILGLVTEAFPHVRAAPFRVRGPASRVHVDMAAVGPFDIIVDDTRVARARAGLFRRCFFHLVDGGTYLVRARRAGAVKLRPDEESVTNFLKRLVCLREEESTASSRREEDERALADSISDLQIRPRHLVVHKVGESYATLTEPQANQVLLMHRGRTGRVVSTIPGMHLESRCRLRESASFRAGGMPDGFQVPELSLRAYADAVCAPGQVVTHGHLLLPDSYRHNQRKRLGNRFIKNLAPRFGRPAQNLSNPSKLSGSYYYLDSEFRGHFGHALTEQVSRLWGWEGAKKADPGLKALVAVNAGRKELAPFERSLFAAGGIEEADIELIEGPVRVDRLVAATPMFANPAYIHPEILGTWAEVGRRLSEQAPDRKYPRRVFCSRREQTGPGAFTGARRVCRNAQQLEEEFAENGFEVIYTEDYDLAEQARIFREAEVVAGYAGSALFNLIFSDSPKHVIVVSSESYTAKNEYLIASAAGHQVDVTWCVAEIPMPMRRWDTAAFNSAFTFDFEREGVFLAEVFAGL